MKPLEFSTERLGVSNDYLKNLVRDQVAQLNKLSEYQFVEALQQALPDFERHVAVKDSSFGQMVVYLPGAEANRWKRKYEELLDAVRSTVEGETRHETALRYIRQGAEQQR